MSAATMPLRKGPSGPRNVPSNARGYLATVGNGGAAQNVAFQIPIVLDAGGLNFAQVGSELEYRGGKTRRFAVWAYATFSGPDATVNLVRLVGAKDTIAVAGLQSGAVGVADATGDIEASFAGFVTLENNANFGIQAINTTAGGDVITITDSQLVLVALN